MAKKYKQMNEKEFNKVKLLAEAGLSTGAISKVTGRACSTVSWVKRSDSFEHYRELTREYLESRRKANEVEAAPVQATEPEAESDMQDIIGKTFYYTPAEQTAVELTRIANALERMADAWESTPDKKRGLFGK